MLFSTNPRVRLERAVYDQAVERARKLGLPSVDAYVAQLIERDLKTSDEQKTRDTVRELKDQMKGLGYLQ